MSTKARKNLETTYCELHHLAHTKELILDYACDFFGPGGKYPIISNLETFRIKIFLRQLFLVNNQIDHLFGENQSLEKNLMKSFPNVSKMSDSKLIEKVNEYVDHLNEPEKIWSLVIEQIGISSECPIMSEERQYSFEILFNQRLRLIEEERKLIIRNLDNKNSKLFFTDLSTYKLYVKKAISNEGYFGPFFLEDEKEHIFCLKNSINRVKVKIILFIKKAEIDKELLVEINKKFAKDDEQSKDTRNEIWLISQENFKKEDIDLIETINPDAFRMGQCSFQKNEIEWEFDKTLLHDHLKLKPDQLIDKFRYKSFEGFERFLNNKNLVNKNYAENSELNKNKNDSENSELIKKKNSDLIELVELDEHNWEIEVPDINKDSQETKIKESEFQWWLKQKYKTFKFKTGKSSSKNTPDVFKAYAADDPSLLPPIIYVLWEEYISLNKLVLPKGEVSKTNKSIENESNGLTVFADQKLKYGSFDLTQIKEGEFQYLSDDHFFSQEDISNMIDSELNDIKNAINSLNLEYKGKFNQKETSLIIDFISDPKKYDSLIKNKKLSKQNAMTSTDWAVVLGVGALAVGGLVWLCTRNSTASRAAFRGTNTAFGAGRLAAAAGTTGLVSYYAALSEEHAMLSNLLGYGFVGLMGGGERRIAPIYTGPQGGKYTLTSGGYKRYMHR